MKAPKPHFACRLQIYSCPDRACLAHVILFNKDDYPVAEAALPEETIRKIIKSLQGILYARVTEEE